MELHIFGAVLHWRLTCSCQHAVPVLPPPPHNSTRYFREVSTKHLLELPAGGWALSNQKRAHKLGQSAGRVSTGNDCMTHGLVGQSTLSLSLLTSRRWDLLESYFRAWACCMVYHGYHSWVPAGPHPLCMQPSTERCASSACTNDC